jgi:hypothetical protein
MKQLQQGQQQELPLLLQLHQQLLLQLQNQNQEYRQLHEWLQRDTRQLCQNEQRELPRHIERFIQLQTLSQDGAPGNETTFPFRHCRHYFLLILPSFDWLAAFHLELLQAPLFIAV